MQGTSSWLWRFNPLLLRLHGEISLSLLSLHSSWGSALDLAMPLHVCRPLVSVLCPDRSGLKAHWLRGSLRSVGGRGTECRVSLWRKRPTWRCRSLRCAVCSPREVVPRSQDPDSGGLHRLLGEEVWIVTCSCTQASWWLPQQPECLMPVSGVCTDSRSSRLSLKLV